MPNYFSFNARHTGFARVAPFRTLKPGDEQEVSDTIKEWLKKHYYPIITIQVFASGECTVQGNNKIEPVDRLKSLLIQGTVKNAKVMAIDPSGAVLSEPRSPAEPATNLLGGISQAGSALGTILPYGNLAIPIANGLVVLLKTLFPARSKFLHKSFIDKQTKFGWYIYDDKNDRESEECEHLMQVVLEVERSAQAPVIDVQAYAAWNKEPMQNSPYPLSVDVKAPDVPTTPDVLPDGQIPLVLTENETAKILRIPKPEEGSRKLPADLPVKNGLKLTPIITSTEEPLYARADVLMWLGEKKSTSKSEDGK